MQGFDHVVLQGHVAKKPHHISITRASMATKLGRMIAFLDGLLPMSHDLLITWPCEIRGSLTGEGSARKRLSRPQFLVIIFCWCHFGPFFYLFVPIAGVIIKTFQKFVYQIA